MSSQNKKNKVKKIIVEIDGIKHLLVRDKEDDCTKCSLYKECRSSSHPYVNLCTMLSGLNSYHFKVDKNEQSKQEK